MISFASLAAQLVIVCKGIASYLACKAYSSDVQVARGHMFQETLVQIRRYSLDSAGLNQTKCNALWGEPARVHAVMINIIIVRCPETTYVCSANYNYCFRCVSVNGTKQLGSIRTKWH